MKIFKYFALLFTLPFMGLFSVDADTGLRVKINNSELVGDYYRQTAQGNVTFEFFDGITYEYGSLIPKNYVVTLCATDTKMTSYYYNGSVPSTGNRGTFSFYVSSYGCQLKENYADGHIVYIYGSNSFLQGQLGQNATLSNVWVAYVNKSTQWSLYSAFLTDESISIDYSNDTIISSNKEIIDQNKEIIKKNQEIIDSQKDTNKKLDDAENTRKGIWGTIKDVLSNIISLPKKIVEFLVDALKDLFIPTEEQITEIIDDSKELSENFGFIGEGVNFSVQLFTSLLNIGQSTGCVDFPEFSLDFTNIDSIGHKVKFWDKSSVCLADNAWFGTDSNGIIVVRSVTTILLIVIFLNFCYKAFFRVLSKASGD